MNPGLILKCVCHNYIPYAVICGDRSLREDRACCREADNTVPDKSLRSRLVQSKYNHVPHANALPPLSHEC